MANLRTAYQLFLNSMRIQIRTEFYVGPNFITGPTNLYAFSSFSLSLKIILDSSLSLFLSAIKEKGSAPSLSHAYPHSTRRRWNCRE